MTVHAAPIVLDFEDGIDRKTLRRLRDRFLQFQIDLLQGIHRTLLLRIGNKSGLREVLFVPGPRPK